MNTITEVDPTCPRCGVSEQMTHHPACQYRDGTPTSLTDEEVRAVLSRPGVDDRVRDRARLAFMFERLGPRERKALLGLLSAMTRHDVTEIDELLSLEHPAVWSDLPF